jgi:hypothetical protein
MTRFGRQRFVALVDRQLDLFEQDHAGLIRDCEAALRAHDTAPADEAEDRYGDFLDLIDTGCDALAEIRDTYEATLDADAAEEYRRVFCKRARRRQPRFALELD